MMRRIRGAAAIAILSLGAAPAATQERPDFYNFEQQPPRYPAPGDFGMPPGTPAPPPPPGQPLPPPRIRLNVPSSGWERDLVSRVRTNLAVVTQVVPYDQAGDYTVFMFWQGRPGGGANVQMVVLDACNGRWCFTGANSYSCAPNAVPCANDMSQFVLDLIRKQRGP